MCFCGFLRVAGCVSVVFSGQSGQSAWGDVFNSVRQAAVLYRVQEPSDYFIRLLPGLKSGDPVSWVQYREMLCNIPYMDIDAAPPELLLFVEKVAKPCLKELVLLDYPPAVEYCYSSIVAQGLKVDPVLNMSAKQLETSMIRAGSKLIRVREMMQKYRVLRKKYIRPSIRPADADLEEMSSILKSIISIKDPLDLDMHTLDEIAGEMCWRWFLIGGYFKNGEGKELLAKLKHGNPEKYYWMQFEKNTSDPEVLKEIADHGEWRAMLYMAMSAASGNSYYKAKNNRLAREWLKKASIRAGIQSINDFDKLVY
jgi:hypothetical protein